jgi:hypothetical protein
VLALILFCLDVVLQIDFLIFNQLFNGRFLQVFFLLLMLRQAGQLHLPIVCAFHLHNQRCTYGGVVGGPGIAATD